MSGAPPGGGSMNAEIQQAARALAAAAPVDVQVDVRHVAALIGHLALTAGNLAALIDCVRDFAQAALAYGDVTAAVDFLADAKAAALEAQPWGSS